MKTILTAASVATIALTLASAANATSTTTTTPYNPTDPTDLSVFENGNELAAQTITYRNDANGKGLDVIVQVVPAGLGNDKADSTLGLQFTNLYFGDTTNGATIGFELGNDSFVPGVFGSNTVYGASAGIVYTDTPGTDYAHGGVGSMSTVYIPYADFTTSVLGQAGFNPYHVGDQLQLRDVQAFSYGGNNAGGDPRFGFVTLGGVPEPASWALMIIGFGAAGASLRRRRAIVAA
jgi:hypothetical protein